MPINNYSTKSELTNENYWAAFGKLWRAQICQKLFRQDLRTSQISALFVENAAASDQGLWERTLSVGVKDSGKGRSFLLRFPHDPLRRTKITPIDLDYVSRR